MRHLEYPVSLPTRGTLELSDAALANGFIDTTYVYRSGPCRHDTTVATLTDAASGVRIVDAFHFP